MEPGKKPDLTRGTLDGSIKPSDITILQIRGTDCARIFAKALFWMLIRKLSGQLALRMFRALCAFIGIAYWGNSTTT